MDVVLQRIKDDLVNNYVTIINLKPRTPMNPQGIAYFVVIFGVFESDTIIGYYDRWDGKIKGAWKDDLYKSWIASGSILQLHP